MATNTGREPDLDFGRYLASVAERDIDLLLMEEFHISPEFVTWFCGRLNLDSVLPDGAWHSVSDTDGETDLLLRVRRGESRIGILIENKVAAPEQDQQAARYHLRATRAVKSGRFDKYLTVMCAPARYLEGLPLSSEYQHRVSYEEIAAWFAKHEDRRSSWRLQILQEAIEQGRRGYTMLVNSAITAFQVAYWNYLRVRHPRLIMAKPTPKGSKSNWIILKATGFPKGVNMHHKFDQDVMELGYQRTNVEEVLAVKSDWPEGIALVQKGGTGSLVISVPHVDVSSKFEDQIGRVETALQSAYRLIPYASLLKPSP